MSDSYVWRGFRGVGKRTKLLKFLEAKAHKLDMNFEIKYSTWFLNKQTNGGDPDEDDEVSGKSIPYEESCLHLGFDVARMSMSDKVFLQSILSRWTGQQDVCLISNINSINSRYLVLYHAHYLTDESVLQLQESLEQYQNFGLLMTSELPVCSRLRDFCFEIPVYGNDTLLQNYINKENMFEKDVWLEYFKKTLDEWSNEWDNNKVADIRNWIYICLQRNLRWTDVIMYWIEAIYSTEWITPNMRNTLCNILWKAESGSGWVLLTSYRIPILWEYIHLKIARTLHKYRKSLHIENH